MREPRSESRRWAELAIVFALVVGVVIVGTPTPVEAAIRDPFSPPVFASQDNGAIALIGNSQMTCPTSASGCATAQSAAPLTTGTDTSINNDFSMAFMDLDGVSGTSNSTSADLAMPAGSVVLFAKLVWGGRRDAGTSGVAAGAAFNQVRWRPPGAASYVTLTSTNTVAPDLGGTDGHPYQASIDVTNQVKAAGNGTYWVADIQAATGGDRYAGWSLVVAYRNPSLPLRDLSIFEGFADVTTTTGNDSVTIPVSGFLTPATGTVNASVGFVTWEGDRGLTGEQVLLNGTQLSDAARPATNFFNSSISDAGANVTNRNANFANNFGLDVGRVVANGVLPNSATSTTLKLTTNREFFYPGIVTTQIDLYTPAFNAISKTVTNLSNHSPAQVGDTLQYQISFSNTGADFADNSNVSDVLAANQTYVPGTINVTASPGNVNNGTKTDAGGDDIAEYDAASRTVRARLGTGASAAAGGTLAPGATVTFRFNVTLDRPSAGTTINNGATLAYRARTIAKDFTFIGNVVSTPVATLADLAVTKSSSPASVAAGGTVQYPVTVTNNGPTSATGVSLADTLPTGTTFVSAAAPPGTSCAASGQTVACDGGILANGASLTFTITATVTPDATVPSLVNTAQVSSATSDDVPANDTASASTTITRSADVVATKTGPAGPLNAGAQITYTIAARNDGPSTATTVRLSDAVPVGTTFVSVTPTGTPVGSCAQDGGSVVCTIAALGPGQTMSAAVVLTVGSGFSAAALTNTAVASSDVPDPNPANNSSSATTTIDRSADVRLTKSATPSTANAGGGVAYTLTVTNAGPSDAQAVTVTDPNVSGLIATAAASSRGTCTVSGANDVSCAIGLLSPGSSATITVQATVDQAFAGTAITNTASAASTTPDPAPADNNATATLTVTTSADVSIVKTGPATVTANADGTYTLTIHNAGPSQATNVSASDTLPSGLTFVSSADGCTATGVVVTCPVNTLAANGTASRTFTFHAPADVPATVANTATVAATTPDPVTATNTSTFTSGGANSADIAVTKSIAPSTLVAGGPITYTMIVTNNGPSTASDVALDDAVPAGVTITSVTTTAGSCQPAPVVQCAAASLAPGASYAVTATGTIAASTAAGTTLANTASSSSTSPADPTLSNNTATATGTVTTSGDVAVTLTAQTPTVTAGTVENYVVHIVNNGPSVARNVVATGQVPPGLIPIVGSSGGVCVLTGQIVTCNLGNLPPGFALDIPLAATVDPSFAPGPISATAFIGSDTPDTVSANNQSTAVIDVIANADLAITKQAPTTLVAGGTATYTLTAVNNGPSDATTVSVTDTLPGGLSLTSVSSSLGACTSSGPALTCTAARLPAGSSMVMHVVVTVSTTAGPTVTNTATVGAITNDPTPGNNSSTTATPVTQSARLTVTKSADPTPAVAGASITYTLTIANAGPSDAASVALHEPMPAGLLVLPAGVTAPPDATCTLSADRTTDDCSFASIPAGTSRIVRVTGLVPATAADGSIITNTATITSTTPDPDPSTHRATVATPVTTSADLVILKTFLDQGVAAGDPHGYLLTVTNNGPSVARAVSLGDPIPSGTTFVSAEPTVGTCGVTAGSMSCSLGDLTPGQIVTVQLTILLGADLGDTTLTNTASTASTTADPDPTNNSSSVSQRVTRRADLALTKAIASGPLVAGAPLSYALSLTNNGPSDTVNARILDPLPAGTTYTSAAGSDGGTCELVPEDTTTTPPTPTLVRCSWAQLPVGATRTATITLGVPDTTSAGAVIHNAATADSAAIDPTPESVTVDGPVVASSDVSLTKALLSGTPIAGGSVRWQVTARNAGPSVATGVTVADVAPGGVRFTAVNTSTGTCTIGASPLCTLGTIPVGGVVTVTLNGTIDPAYSAATVSNTATAASTSSDPDTTNNQATSTTTVATSADLVVVKTAGPGAFVAGATAQWAVRVTNVGPSTSRSVVVNDSLPTGLTGVTATASTGGTCSIGASVSCLLGDLAAGADATVTIRGTISPDFVAGSTTNSASATASTPDPDPTSNSATVISPVGTSADVHIAKSGPSFAAPGGTITWQLTVVNDGPSVAQAVVVTDQLPPDLITARAVVGATPCTITAGTVRCEVGAVPVSDGTSETSRLVTVTATVDPASTRGTLTNTAQVSSSTDDPDQSDNSDQSVTTLSPSADVAIHKTSDASPIVPGSSAGWTIDVTNAGPSVARSLVVNDAVPDGVTLQTAEVTVNGSTTACAVVGSGVACTVGDLSPGLPARVHLTGTVDQGLVVDTLANTAELSSATPDPTPGDHTSTSSNPMEASADMRIAKSVDLSSGLPVAGGPIRFLVAVDNLGPSAAQDVVVDDVLPAAIVPATVTVSPAACTYTAVTGAIACPLGTLDVGGHVDITIDGTLTTTASDVANTATVGSPTPDPVLKNNTSTAAAVSDQLADVAVTKTGPASVVAGQRLAWTITVRNGGPSAATDVTLTDTLPNGLTDVLVTPDAGVTCSTAGGLSCDIGTLDNGEATTVEVSALVPPDSSALSHTNAVQISSTTADPNGANNTATFTTSVTRQALLRITKVADPDPFVPGRDASYTVVVANEGPSDAAATLVADRLDPTLVPNGPAVPTQGTCSYTATTLNCTLGVVPAGGQATVRIPVHVDPSTTVTTLTNTATVTSATPSPPGSPPPTASVTSDVTPLADLTITKTAPDEVTAGTPIAWTISVANAGPSAASDVDVTDALPPDLGDKTIVASQGACTQQGDTISCSLGTLAPGATATIQVTGSVPPDSTATALVNTATVTSPTPEPIAGPDGRSTQTTTHVVTRADVEVAKRADIDPAVPGEAVHWTITIGNRGPSVARDVAVADTLPPGLTDVTISGPAGVTCDAPTSTCTIPVLEVGADAAVSIEVTAMLPADATNPTSTNSVAANSPVTPDPDPGNNEASVTTPIKPSADLNITKVAPTTVVRGTTITWTITVTDVGPSTARSVIVDDPIPAGVADIVVSGVPDATCTTAVHCELGDIAPGSPPIEITVTGTVAPDLAHDVLINEATVASNTSDPHPDDDHAATATDATSQAALTWTKDGPATAVAGGPISWTITVTNNGPSVARSVAVVDQLPTGILGVGASTSAGTCDATVHCQLGTMAVGAVATITIAGTVDPAHTAGRITNAATVTSPDQAATDPPPPVGTDVTRSAHIDITKAVTSGRTVAGEQVTWTITVTNAGPSTADGVEVVDNLPVSVTDVTATTSAGACAVATGVLQCALGTMTTQPVTITVNGTIDPAFRGQLTNTATATSTTQDPDVAASATATSTVTGAIDLAITKTADHDRGVVGQTVTFTIVASNAGPSTATDVAVDDGLPAGLVLAAARTSAGTFDATTRRWKIGTLATGASATLQLDTTLDSVGTQTNLATIGQITSDPDPPPTPIGPEESRVDNNQATASVEVFAAADQLPRTGSDAWIILRIAALLLAAGAGLTMGVHRVRRRRPA